MRTHGLWQGSAGDPFHFSLSLSLWFCFCLSLGVFTSPAGTACVKTGPLVGRHLPILDTHFLSPSREPTRLTPSCP